MPPHKTTTLVFRSPKELTLAFFGTKGSRKRVRTVPETPIPYTTCNRALPVIFRLCKFMNYPNRPQDIEAMFAEVDTDRNGTLDMHEFLTYMQCKRPKPELLYGMSKHEYEQFMMQFHVYDRDGDGMPRRASCSAVRHMPPCPGQLWCQLSAAEQEESQLQPL